MTAMKYTGKKCLMTGWSGFIGSSLQRRLSEEGAGLILFEGDVRDRAALDAVFSHSLDYVFHFGSPSSQVLFARNSGYCVDATINGFINIATLCQRFGSKLIYPSTGLISQNKYNQYARCKKILEDMHLNSNLDALGLRIYATYGAGESHKRDYASPVYLFARDMIGGRRPVVFGDGTQERDFIHISDLVDCIMILAEECNGKIVEIGSGSPISFNQIVDIINQQAGTNVSPVYVDRPAEYYESTRCDTSEMKKFFNRPLVSITDGIRGLIGK